MNFFRKRDLSEKAADLIRFDQDSIKQVAAAERQPLPETWLIDPDEYERNGRILRDSASPRMLAYSTKNQTLYATDGCNSCTRRLPKTLSALTERDLRAFAADNELRIELLQRLALLLKDGP